MFIRTPTDLGRAIRALRRGQGITQAQLALTAGTNRRFIVDLERGKPTAQIGKALEVLAVLGAAVDVAVPASDAQPSAPKTRSKARKPAP
jgi:y4mF family transcriptional regulator